MREQILEHLQKEHPGFFFDTILINGLHDDVQRRHIKCNASILKTNWIPEQVRGACKNDSGFFEDFLQSISKQVSAELATR